MANRKTNTRKLYENELAGDKCRNVVSLNESWAMLTIDGRSKDICYVKKGENMPEDYVKKTRQLWSEKFMMVGIITYHGTLPLIRIPVGITVNSNFYVEYVLKHTIDMLLKFFDGDIS